MTQSRPGARILAVMLVCIASARVSAAQHAVGHQARPPQDEGLNLAPIEALMKGTEQIDQVCSFSASCGTSKTGTFIPNPTTACVGYGIAGGQAFFSQMDTYRFHGTAGQVISGDVISEQLAGGILFLVRVSDNSVIASDFTHQPYSNLQIAASIPTTGDYVFEIASFDPPTTSPATYTFDFDCYAGGIAELSPYKPGGWSSSVVLSTVQGSRTDSASLASRTPIYLSLAITNDGALPVLDTFSVDIQLDGQTVKHLIGGSLIPGWFYTWEDISLGTLPDGDHSFAVVIDSGGLIPEGNEQDNIITRTLRVGAGGRVSCSPNSKTLCLEQGRFAVTARWQKPDSTSGDGTAVSLTGDSGYFWFFAPANIEIVTKVLFACTVNSSHWVFAGGLTNVGVTLTVRDTVTGAVKTYINPVNTAFEPLQDTGAFPCP